MQNHLKFPIILSGRRGQTGQFSLTSDLPSKPESGKQHVVKTGQLSCLQNTRTFLGEVTVRNKNHVQKSTKLSLAATRELHHGLQRRYLQRISSSACHCQQRRQKSYCARTRVEHLQGWRGKAKHWNGSPGRKLATVGPKLAANSGWDKASLVRALPTSTHH